jgi:hypothetical protein
MKSLNTILVPVGAALLAFAGTAQAALSYTVGDWSNQFPGPNDPPSTASHVLDGLGYPGDTVEFEGVAGMPLAEGTSILKINTLLWDISYTYAGAGDPLNPDAGWVELDFPFTATRSLTIGSETVNISQSGLLEVNWDNDYLSLSAGPTVTVVVDGYEVAITPLGLSRVGGSNFDGFPGGTPWTQPSRDVMAEFVVTPIPEPTTFAVGALLLLPFAASTIRKFRKNSQA